MEIVTARWTKDVNMLLIKCYHCGKQHEHRSDRWRVICPHCGFRGNLSMAREKLFQMEATS